MVGQVSASGRVIRQSTGTTDKRTAQRFLDSRVGRAAEGQPILPRADRVRYEEAAEDLRLYPGATGGRARSWWHTWPASIAAIPSRAMLTSGTQRCAWGTFLDTPQGGQIEIRNVKA